MLLCNPEECNYTRQTPASHCVEEERHGDNGEVTEADHPQKDDDVSVGKVRATNGARVGDSGHQAEQRVLKDNGSGENWKGMCREESPDDEWGKIK